MTMESNHLRSMKPRSMSCMINSVSEHGGDCVRPRSMGCISSISEHGDNGNTSTKMRRRRSGQPKRAQSIHALKIPKSSDHSIIEKYGIPKESDHSHRGKCSRSDEVVVSLKKKRSSVPKKAKSIIQTSTVISPCSSVSSEEEMKSPIRKKQRSISSKRKPTSVRALDDGDDAPTPTPTMFTNSSSDNKTLNDKRQPLMRTDSSSGSSFALSDEDSSEEAEQPQQQQPEAFGKKLTAWQKREQFKQRAPPRSVAQRSRSISVLMNNTDDEDEGMATNAPRQVSMFQAKKRHSAPLPVHLEEEDNTPVNSKSVERRSSTKPAWKLREEARKKAIAKIRDEKVDVDARTYEMQKYLQLDEKKCQDDDDYDDLDTPSFHESSELYFDDDRF